MNHDLTSDIGPYALSPECVLELPISDRAYRLYHYLALRANRKTHIAYPKRSTMAGKLRCSTKSVDRALGELVDSGAIEVRKRRSEHGDWDSNLYVVRLAKRVATALSLPDTGDQVVDSPVQGGDTGVPTGGDSPVPTGGDTGVPLNQNQLEPEPIEQEKKSTRARQLPDDFAPDDDLLDWAKRKHPTVDAISETTQFRDYHRARGSTMKDWEAAWRTWIRNAERFAKTRTNGSGSYRNEDEWSPAERGLA